MSAWLDRLSAHTTPSPSPVPQRPFSPAPRRSVHLAPTRPNLSTRSSSLSFASESTLPIASKTSQPSALRNQLSSAPAPDIRDPLDTLANLLGISTQSIQSHALERDEEVFEDAQLQSAGDVAFDGLSLEKFLQDDIRSADASSHAYSPQSVEKYARERNKFEDLHKQIQACDELLQSVEKYLSSFHADLAAVSAEIESLQTRSTELNKKLDNRKSVEKILNPIIDQFTISPSVVKSISDSPVDGNWATALDELNTRHKALSLKGASYTDIKAVEDLQPLVHNLSDKAVERIRDYFAAQIKALRAPNINAQINQQQYYLPLKPAYAFLATRQPQLGAEIAQAYTNTMRWYYSSGFTRYHAALTKIKLYVTDAKSLLGEDPNPIARNRNAATVSQSHDPFNLGRRNEPLRNPSSAALPTHAAEETKTNQHMETPFIAFNLALLDNASFEYNFAMYFFNPSISIPTINRYFNTMFAPVFSLGTQLAKSLIAESYDALGILLLVRLTQHFAFVLQRRKIPTLDAYVNGLSMMLWPRYQQLLDAHCESLKRLTAALPKRTAGSSGASAAASALIGGNRDTGISSGVPGGLSTAPHPVTQRFATFVAGILMLSAEAGDNEPVSNSLLRLRNEYEAFLARLGQGFGSTEKGKRDRRRLEQNNYALVLTLLDDIRGRLAEEMKQRFQELISDPEA